MAVLFTIIRYLCEVLTVAIIIRSLLSWVSPRPTSITVFMDKITEPVLSPLRRIMPRAGMFDFTPMAAIILLQIIAYLLP